MTRKKSMTLYSLVAVGLMAALVFAGNKLQIRIVVFGFPMRIHLGNSMCLLAGLLFGRMRGGLSSGIGGALFDLFDPMYILSAPFTFLSKFAMGFVTGHLAKHIGKGIGGAYAAAAAGQLTYILLYLTKSFIGQLIIGEPLSVALKLTGVNAVTSWINGLLACLIAVPLYAALKKALMHTSVFGALIAEK